MSIVSVKQLKKRYLDGDRLVEVLHGLDLEMNAGDFVSIQGASGAGKSTLLNILGALDNFDEGEVTINNVHLHQTSRNRLHLFRRQHLGFVFQYHYLLPEFTVLENVMMPLMILERDRSEARKAALDVLDKVGLAHRVEHYPAQISGGESQRVAVARALVHRPPLILADEPTGNLDGANTDRFIAVLNQLISEENLTVLVVTHEQDLARTAPRQLRMTGGHLEELEAQVRQVAAKPQAEEVKHSSTRVTLEAKKASWWGRAFAYFLDMVIAFQALFLIDYLLKLFDFNPESSFASFTFFTLRYLVLSILFIFWGAFFEYKFGATPGKLALGYRVYGSTGKLTFMQAFIRNLCKNYLSTFLLYLGFFIALFDKDRRTWHDMIAKTQVIVKA